MISNALTLILKPVKSNGLLTVLALILANVTLGQCRLMKFIPDTVLFKDIEIRYIPNGDLVYLEYTIDGRTFKVDENYSIHCDLNYMPGVPHPEWKNDHFLSFGRGCGTSCFDSYYVPLHEGVSAHFGGQFLIDTVNTISMSLRLDTVDYAPYLFIQNHLTGETQREALDSKDFPGAIPFDNLDYSPLHPEGFEYISGQLTLFIRKDERRVFQVNL